MVAQIFATDINSHTVQLARKASYTEASLSKIPQYLRNKYFTRQQQNYTANQVLVEMMIFSQHNVLQDPPFIRVDLVSCRNLLIYLTQESQQRLLKVFHYALVTNGLLFLGHSETIGNLSNAFAEYDKKHKLYIKQGSHFFPPILNTGINSPLTIAQNARLPVTNEVKFRRLGEQKIVELYAKPAILATQQGEILEFYNDCAPFIKVKPGSADFNLFSILDPLLKAEIKALLYQARHIKGSVVSQPIPLFIEEREQLFYLHFNLLNSPLSEEQLILISFDNSFNTEGVKTTDLELGSELITGLKHELNIRRETLHTVTEALETSILELQSLNEESQVSNEELQSTNEELETSNEELQSTNEELSVLNDALAEKTEELEDINDDFENVLNSIHNAVLVIDENLIVHQFNETSRHFFNLDTAGNQLPNLSSIEAFFHAEALIGQIKQVIKTGVVFQDTLLKQNQYYELLIYPYLNKRGKNKPGAVITIRDITDKHKAEQKIHTAAQVFEAASEGIMITDKEKRMISVNPAFSTITGYTCSEVIGKSPGVLSSSRQDKVFYQQMWNSIENTGKWQGKIWNQNKKGDIYPEWLSISSLADKDGKSNGYIGIFSDITKLVEAQQMILQQANFDALTQLPNRNLFFDRLQQAMIQAKRQNQQLGIMFIDLDGFKVINDSLGHSQGDMILQKIAERMRQVSRESDVFARFGGDEFTCLISNIKSASDIIPFVEKLLQAIDTPVTVKGITLHITASIGISIYPDNGDDAETLIKHADNAMYKAKDDGRNTYQFFTSQMHEQVLNHYRMGNDLKFAIKHNTFQVYYQPVVELKTLKIVGAEALIRWEHPTKGGLLPDEFIHIAEDLNLISDIGEFVLGKACRFIAKLNKILQQPLHIAINFSNQQFMHENCVENCLKIMAETQIDMHQVIVEITESQMVTKQVRFLEQLNMLRENGIRIAMDDFGTGYSSLSFLKQIPLDILKIDKSFVQDILTDKSDASLVETILDIASNFGLQVVAEGVELEEHVAFLNKRGCALAQGYYFSKPISEDEFAQMVRSGFK